MSGSCHGVAAVVQASHNLLPECARRAFFRVFAFHILLFQVMASLAWSNNNVRIASYALITHAALSWVEQCASCWTQRSASACSAQF